MDVNTNAGSSGTSYDPTKPFLPAPPPGSAADGSTSTQGTEGTESDTAVAAHKHKHGTNVAGSDVLEEEVPVLPSYLGGKSANVDTISSAIAEQDETSTTSTATESSTSDSTIQAIKQDSQELIKFIDTNYFKEIGKSRNDAPPSSGSMPTPSNVNIEGIEGFGGKRSAWFDAQGLTSATIAIQAACRQLQKAQQIDVKILSNQLQNVMELAHATAAADIKKGELEKEQYTAMAMADIASICMSAMSIGMTLKSGMFANKKLGQEQDEHIGALQSKYSAEKNADGSPNPYKKIYEKDPLTKAHLENEEFVNKLGVQDPHEPKSKEILKQEQLLQDFMKGKTQRREAIRQQDMMLWNSVGQIGDQASSTAKNFIQAAYAVPIAEQEAAKSLLQGLSQSQNTTMNATESDEKSLQDTINTMIQNLAKIIDTVTSIKTF